MTPVSPYTEKPGLRYVYRGAPRLGRVRGMTTPQPQCAWPIDSACLPEVAPGNEAAMQQATATATAVLWALTGRRFGVCPASDRIEPLDSYGKCPPAASSRAYRMPWGVQAVLSITDDEGRPVEGVTVSGDWLMGLPTGAVNVEYLTGEPHPAGSAYAAGRLAKEVYLGCIGDSKCQLPRGVSQASRQGVTVSFADQHDMIQRRLTGLADVDLWITSVNPNKDMMPSEVL